ncbi:MAG: DUF3604 domain-containing protein [Proteobacteria bacterium]|nr:DUF3604 domain-containing protein [Pseudomonadota bacterium]
MTALWYRFGTFALAGALLACSPDGETPPDSQALGEETPAGGDSQETVAGNPLKEAYFGDLHIHSRWSFDAYSTQVPVGPDQAYRYARGEAIDHVSGRQIQMQGPPLDFMALTEHGTYMGVSATIDDPESPVHQVQLIRDLSSPDPAVSGAAFSSFMQSLNTGVALPELVTDEVIEPTWRNIVELADRNYRPGEFTSFVAYEYTSMPDGQNLHRNVIFRGSDVPSRPFSAADSPNPEDLWAWMEETRQAGDDVLSIPHNANGGNGLMYRDVNTAGEPLDAAYAELRLRNEPVSEVYQIKGQSETHPILSTDDEWADFEVFDRILGQPDAHSQPAGSYVRDALKTGLRLEAAQGFNPYRIGMVAASDGHNASSPTEEANYTGKLGFIDGTPEARLGAGGSALPELEIASDFEPPENMALMWGAAGLAGVWAESNTREALFDAMRARETFATSGPRIRLRFFGGWDFAPDDLGAEMVERGYAAGVPMGGVLAAARGEAPRFLIGAVQDPLEAPLERVQIVKGWVEDSEAREKVFDVACGDGAGPDSATHRCAIQVSGPNLEDCSIDARQGASQLSAVWSDPEYDTGQRAFYYLRALQIPTCRWSTWDALRLGVPRPENAHATIQERAVTSPIWLNPEG